MRCENSALGLREIECEFFDSSDGGHIGSLAESDSGARAGKATNDVHAPEPSKTARRSHEWLPCEPSGSGGGFAQCYNAQAAVEVESRLIVGQRVSDAPNDKQQLVPSLRAVEAAAGAVSEVLIDSGFLSKAAVRAVETSEVGMASGVRVLAAMGRERHGRGIKDLEKRGDPPAPEPEAPWAEHMAHRGATKSGLARYKLRQQTVEPVFGIIKSALGFRAFRLRGLAGTALEWCLVSLAYNLRRLHCMGAKLCAA